MSRWSRWLPHWLSKRSLVPLVLGTAALGLIWGRFAVEAHRAVADARAALAGGDRVEAVRAYRDALRVYVPGSPFERQALDGLQDLADDAHRARDTLGERQALEAIRSGLLGTRGIIVPQRARLASAQARLEEMDFVTSFVSPELVAPRGHHGPGRLSDARGPAVLSTLIALVGLATWMASVVLLVRAGIEERQGRVQPRAGDPPPAESPVAVPPAGLRLVVPVLFVIGVALFLIGLRGA